MFESGRKKAGARRGAQRPVNVGFAPTEAKRRYEPVRVRQDSFNIERGYPLGYPLSILRRARDGTRTRDPDLGKVVLHQLSHSRIKMIFTLVKSARRDSNPRPRPWQGRAPPTEPLAHKDDIHSCEERETGLEPATPTLARSCSTN